MATRYQGTEYDANNAIVPGASIYVLDRTGADLQALTDDMGNSLPNPITSDDLGTYYFNVAIPDVYFLRHFYNGREQLREFVPVGVASDAVFKGDAATIDPGTVTTLSAGSPATVTNVGTENAAIFDFGIPAGPAGSAATVAVNSTTTLASGSSATVTNSGTSSAALLNFGIPAGPQGPAAPTTQQFLNMYNVLATTTARARPYLTPLVTGSAVGAFAFTFANPFTSQTIIRRIRVGKSVSGSATVKMFRASRSGNNITPLDSNFAIATVTGTGSGTTAPVSADVIDQNGNNGMQFAVGDLLGFIVTANAFDFNTPTTGDEGGYYGLSGGTSTTYTASGLTTNVRLQISFEGDNLSDVPAPLIRVNLNTVDRVGVVADSFWASAFVLQDKAPISDISSLTDWNFENYALSGSEHVGEASGVQSRYNAIRASTALYGTLAYPAYKATYALVALGTNDSLQSVSVNTVMDSDARVVEETVRGLGAVPIVSSNHPDPTQWGFGQSAIYKSIAEQYGGYFLNNQQYAKRLGQKQMTFSNNLWLAGHPGMRANKFFLTSVTEMLDSLGRPRSSCKIFRPRPGVTISTIADIYYRDDRRDFYRCKVWKEISTGHYALVSGSSAKWDRVSTLAPSDYGAVTSEYLTLMAGSSLAFTDYALIEFVAPHTAKHCASAVFQMNDVGATVYIPNNLGGSYSTTGPTGAWTAVTGSSGVFTISASQLQQGMRFDKLPVLIVKSGAFNLTQLPELRYAANGPAKPQPAIRDVRRRAKGTQLLSNPSFPTSGSPTGWTTSGTVTTFTPVDPIPGTTGGVQLVAGASISANVTVAPNAYEDQVIEVRVVARKQVADYDPAGGYPGTSPVTSDTFDFSRVFCSVGVPAGNPKQWEPVGMGWMEIVFRSVVPTASPGTTPVTTQAITVTADTEVIEIAEVRAAMLDG